MLLARAICNALWEFAGAAAIGASEALASASASASASAGALASGSEAARLAGERSRYRGTIGAARQRGGNLARPVRITRLTISRAARYSSDWRAAKRGGSHSEGYRKMIKALVGLVIAGGALASECANTGVLASVIASARALAASAGVVF